MIKFFRSIRRKLLSEEKNKAYVKYAIGEIALVVIGILIALQINNWNQHRLNKNLETQILSGLELELERVENRLLYWRSFDLKHQNLVSKVLKYDSTNAHKASMDSLFSCLLFVNVFDKGGGPLEAIINSGRLELVSDRNIRKIIASWPDKLEDIHTNNLSVRDLVWREFIPYMASFGIPSYTCDSLLIYCTVDEPIPNNYFAILSDPKFKALLRSRNKIYAMNADDLLSKAESASELRQMINEYLQQD